MKYFGKRALVLLLAICMVFSAFTFSALAAEASEAEPITLQSLPFADVSVDAWFYLAVRYVFENDIMRGTSDTAFSPNATLTRAMVATILYRLESEPSVAFRQIFNDVASGRWYSDAVTWAYDAGVVQGLGGGRFAPNDSLTREQLAVMMHRLAQDRNDDVSVPANANVPAGVSTWASEAMRWAVYNHFIFAENPRNNASRADTANFVYRFSNPNTATPPPQPPQPPQQPAPPTYTLHTGTFTVGEDLPAGRFVVTSQGSGNFFVRNTEGRLVVNEILNNAGGPGRHGVVNVTTDFGVGYQIEIRGMARAIFTPVTRTLSHTLTTGHWVVGVDIPAGRFDATPAINDSGNFIVHHANGRLAYNEILGSRTPMLRVNLQEGQTIRISSLSSVSFAAV